MARRSTINTTTDRTKTSSILEENKEVFNEEEER
jgi:hypothetical protein